MTLKSVTVKDYMATGLVTLTPGMGVMEAVQKFLDYRISGAPVVDERGNMIGMLSEKDCLKVVLNAAYHEEMGGTVSDFMMKDVVTIDASTGIVEVAEMFIKSSFRRYPVVSDDKLIGQISRRDVLKALEKLW
ncbi:MAG: CBS domain-containing protein [Gammaproteobacteria bacterium]|nr:MAG: CBS domain-containing protein [Gammaproteobacteria bacterium]RLA23395.1 MAG: CBS domain-containing protein [Gammaproteobacteria bacterium]